MSDLSNPFDDLDRLAPDVDTAAAHATFRTSRTHRQTARRVGMVVAAAAALAVLGFAGTLLGSDRDEPLATTAGDPGSDTLAPVGFTVLAVEEGPHEMGTLRAALDEETHVEQWRTLGRADVAPTVDFGEVVVVSITIPDDACPPELEAFDRNGDEVTPVFVETAPGCEQPLIPKTFVVALELATLPDVFTVVLPGDNTYDFSEQRLTIDTRARPGEDNTADTTTTTTGPEQSDLPGERIETFPYEGADLVVVAVPQGESVPIYATPDDTSEVVGELTVSDTGIIATGHNRQVAGTFWNEVEYQGSRGWLDRSAALQLGATEDITTDLYPETGSRPTALSPVALAETVVDAFADAPEHAPVVVDSSPQGGGTTRVTVDLLHSGDDSSGGVRLTVLADATDDGQFTVRAIELTGLCLRGGGPSGCL